MEFCGYSVPHPVEAKMHLRIQTKVAVHAMWLIDRRKCHSNPDQGSEEFPANL